MTSFRPTCTTCWTLRPVGSVRCADCGTRLLPLPLINLPIKRGGPTIPGVEVVVLDTLYCHRRVYSTHSEDSYGTHQERRVRARALAFARCDELNRAHEEAVA